MKPDFLSAGSDHLDEHAALLSGALDVWENEGGSLGPADHVRSGQKRGEASMRRRKHTLLSGSLLNRS